MYILKVRKLNSAFVEKRLALYEYGFADSRALSHGAKDGDSTAMQRAAQEMARAINKGSVLIPIPNSCGYANTTLALCEEIAKHGDFVVLDALIGKRREVTLYDLKQARKSVANVDFGYKVREGVEIPANAILVDNVYDTGTTYRAASKASGVERIIVIGASPSSGVRCLRKMSTKILL